MQPCPHCTCHWLGTSQEDDSEAVVDPEVIGGTVSQSVPQSGSLGDLRNIFPWLLQHIDRAAYDKLIKNNFSQVFLLSITSSCWDTFWRETTFIKICLTEAQGKRYVLCLHFIITSQGIRGNHVALSPSFMDSCSSTTFSNSFPCPANGYTSEGSDSRLLLLSLHLYPQWILKTSTSVSCSHFPEILFLQLLT